MKQPIKTAVSKIKISADFARQQAPHLQVLVNIHYLMERSLLDPEKMQSLIQMGSSALNTLVKTSRRAQTGTASPRPDDQGARAKSKLGTARLAKLCEICLHLPRVQMRNRGSHAIFLVADKAFAYYLSNHHNDGIIGICCKVRPGERDALLASAPLKWYIPAHLGLKGWIGLRVDRTTLDWREVSDLIRGSYSQAESAQ